MYPQSTLYIYHSKGLFIWENLTRVEPGSGLPGCNALLTFHAVSTINKDSLYMRVYLTRVNPEASQPALHQPGYSLK